MRNKNLMTKKEINLEEILTEFRIWNRAWDMFDKDNKLNPQPKSSMELARDLNKIYKVKKR